MDKIDRAKMTAAQIADMLNEQDANNDIEFYPTPDGAGLGYRRNTKGSGVKMPDVKPPRQDNVPWWHEYHDPCVESVTKSETIGNVSITTSVSFSQK